MIKRMGMTFLLLISGGLMIYLFRLKGWSSICLLISSILFLPVFLKMGKEWKKVEKSKLYNSRKAYFIHCALRRRGQIDSATWTISDISGVSDINTGSDINAVSDASGITDILLRELHMWKQRILLYHRKKGIMAKEILLACILALFLCFAVRLLLPFDLIYDYENTAIYQGSTVVVYTGVLVLLFCVFRFCLLTCPESRKGSADSVEEQFFYWLLSGSQHFQQGSMYHAIQQSGQEWEGDFQKEIQKLLEGIYEMPDSPVPYENFFGDRDLPELHMGMKLLYSLSRSDDPDAGKRMVSFVKRNLWRLAQMETDRYQSSLSRVRFIRQIPMVLAGSKIVLDAFALVWVMAQNGGLS